jgi:hypothetical protein
MQFVVVEGIEERLPGVEVVPLFIQGPCFDEEVGGGAVVGAAPVRDEAMRALFVESDGDVRVRVVGSVGDLRQVRDAE